MSLIIPPVKRRQLLTGVALVILGVIGLYITIVKGVKPSFLQLKSFTLYSYYLEGKFFTLITNNQGDELSMVLYWVGWLLINGSYQHQLRKTLTIFAIANLAGYLLFHGVAVIYFSLLLLLFTPLLLITSSK